MNKPAFVFPGQGSQAVGMMQPFAETRAVPSHDDPRLAWRQLLQGGAEIHTVPGHDSGSMLDEPHVRVLARQFKVCLERARRSVTAADRA